MPAESHGNHFMSTIKGKMQQKMQWNYLLGTLLFLKVIGSLYLDQLLCDNDLNECCWMLPDRPIHLWSSCFFRGGLGTQHTSILILFLLQTKLIISDRATPLLSHKTLSSASGSFTARVIYLICWWTGDIYHLYPFSDWGNNFWASKPSI